MSSNTFIKLIVSLVILAGAAYWLNRPEGKISYKGVSSGDVVLSGLDVNAINRIEISSGASTTVLDRTEGGWTAGSLYGYPARFDRIAGMLRSLADLTVGQVQRDGEDSLAGYGLDPAGTEADYHHVVLTAADGKTVSIELGALKQMRDASSMGMGLPTGRYVRTGDGPVVLVEEMLTSVLSTPGEWVDRSLLSVPADSIATVSITSTNDELTIRRNDENQFDIGVIDEGTLVDQSAVLRVLQAFQSLRFDTLTDPGLPDEQAGMTANEIVTVRTKEAMEYRLTIGSLPDDATRRPVRISVAWKPDPENAEEGKDEKTAEAASLNARFAGWTYQVPMGVINQMLATRAGLITQAAPPPATAPTSSSGSEATP